MRSNTSSWVDSIFVFWFVYCFFFFCFPLFLSYPRCAAGIEKLERNNEENNAGAKSRPKLG